MPRQSFKTTMFVGAAVSSCFFSPTVFAQTAQRQASLQEIIVTARKREESVQDIPIPVSVQTGESLQEHQITDAYALQNVTPSLGTQATINHPGQPTFAIRGIGTAVFGPQVEASVGLVVDDIPISRIQLGNIQFFDINRVEVLRGPQGMLFGKNASAGLINIVTSDPVLNQTEFLGHAQYGNMNSPTNGNRYRADAAANVPLGDQSAFRLSGFYTQDDGYAKNVFQSQDLGMDMYGGRFKFLLQPTDAIKILIAADYAHEDGLAEGVFASSFDSPGGIVEGLNAAHGIKAGRENDLQASDGPNSNNFALWGASFNLEFQLGGGYTLTNIAGYREESGLQVGDSDALPVDILNINKVDQAYHQATEELRISSPQNQRFSFQAGLFYLDLNASSLNSFQGQAGIPYLTSILAPPGTPPNCIAGSAAGCLVPPPGFFYQNWSIGQDFENKSKAVFFEGQYKLTDSLRLTAGARYTHDDLNYLATCDQQANNLLPICLSATGSPAPVRNPNSTTKSNTSYRASLAYDITDGVMTYLGYGRGYKGPTFDQTTAALVGAEIPTDWELGVKSTLFQGRLQLNAALFSEEFDGFQTQTVSPNQTVRTKNAGKLKSHGAEIEFTALPLNSLTLSGGVTYNKTEYVGLDSVACWFGQAVGTAPNLCNPATNTSSADGNQLQNAPEWTGSLTARYQHSLWSGWSGFVQGTGYFKSSFNFSQVENPHTKVDGYQTFDLSAGARTDDGRWGVTLFVRNLSDERVPVFINASPAGSLFNVFVTGSESQGDYVHQLNGDSFRTIGVSVDFHL